MADWKQITARIRRARTGKDPAVQLSTLYEKTQDAMVAFELARVFETASQNAEAAKWYSLAAARFRRADWKTKAQEAAARLGGESGPDSQLDFPQLVPPAIPVPEAGAPFEDSAAIFDALASPANERSMTSSETEPESEAETEESVETSSGTPAGTSATEKQAGENGRRRRGRRGGRNRRKPRSTSASSQTGTKHSHSESAATSRASASAAESESSSERPVRSYEASMPRLPIEAAPAATDAGGIALRGRYGDPGLSSRLSLLEMQFRRLLTCAPIKLDEVTSAPAGPGVLLLTDSDLTSYYYVESCQTLRIAIPALLRGGASRRGADSIKPQLAEHLGIPEARVGKYLAEHCVVRWLQLDEGASHFAHFVTAVLRPTLND
jgi:hypothetical protein